MNWQGTFLTNAGIALQAKVNAGKTKLNLTKLKTGDGIPDVLETMTDLKHPMQVIGINSVNYSENGKVDVCGVISNAELAEGYYIREFGLFAADDSGNEVLYAVSVDPNPDYLQDKTSPTVISEELGLTIAISNAESINVTINKAGMASILDVQNMISEHNKKDNAHANFAMWGYDDDGNIHPLERTV